jgi:hypothetical protein
MAAMTPVAQTRRCMVVLPVLASVLRAIQPFGQADALRRDSLRISDFCANQAKFF